MKKAQAAGWRSFFSKEDPFLLILEKSAEKYKTAITAIAATENLDTPEAARSRRIAPSR